MEKFPGIDAMNPSRYHFEVIDSTNSYAKSLILQDPPPPEGSMVTADAQTAGRGRMERAWQSETGMNFLASFIFYPGRDPSEWGVMPLAAGLAVAETVRSCIPSEVTIKWPNDVYAGGKKIAGILLESGMLGNQPWLVAGIGLNCRQTVFEGEFRVEPTSLMLESGLFFGNDEICDILSRRLYHWYDVWSEQGNAFIIDEWKQQSGMPGKRITVQDDGVSRSGTVADINIDGSLLLRTEAGEVVSLYSGDVTSVNMDRQIQKPRS